MSAGAADPKPWQRFAAGTASGAALVLVGHPLDTLKVKLQVGQATSLSNLVVKLARDEGLRGFYRGFAPPLLLTGFVNTVLWGTQFTLVDVMRSRGTSASATQLAMLASIPSGILISVIVTPIEGIKTRQQTRGRSEGAAVVMKDVLQRDGVRGLYRGFSSVCLCRASNFAYFGGNVAVSELITRVWPSSSRWTKSVVAGGCAGICYWLVAFPFDVVKARLMAAPDGARPPLYSGFFDCARKLYAQSGMRGFTRGFLPTILRAFPANAAAFTAFETTMSMMASESATS